MRTAVVLSMCLVVTTAIAAKPAVYHRDAAFVDKMTLSFAATNDQSAFDAFVQAANDRKYSTDKANKFYLPHLKSSYGILDAAHDTVGPIANLIEVGLQKPGLGAAVEAGVALGDVAVKLEDKWLSDPKKILSLEEIRNIVVENLRLAEENGSLDDILAAWGHRLNSNVAAGDFPVAIETLARSAEANSLLQMTNDNVVAGQAQTTKLLEKLMRQIQAEKPTKEELKRLEEVRKIEANFKAREGRLGTYQAQLNVLSSLASAFKIDDLRKPLALAQFGVTASQALNTWKKASTLADATQPNADWVLAADMTTAALAAYQILSGAPSSDEIIMGELAAIKEMLAAIDKKLNYIIEMSERNFEQIIVTLDIQRFLIDKILKNSEITVEKLYSDELRSYVAEARGVTDVYVKWGRDCANVKSRFCRPKDFYQIVYNDITSRKGLDKSEIFSVEKNILKLSVDTTEQELEEYRKSSSGQYLLALTRALMRQRLKKDLAPAILNYYKYAYDTLAVSPDKPIDHVNPRIWNDAVSTIAAISTKTKVRIDKDILKAAQTEGQRLARYYQLSASPEMHTVLQIELQLAASELESAVGKLKGQLYSTYVENRLQPGKEIPRYRFIQGITTCPRYHHPVVGEASQAIQKSVVYGGSTFKEYRKFALLEYLGAGEIDHCYFYDSYDKNDRIPIFSYFRFIWNADKVELARQFAVPLGNALSDETIASDHAKNRMGGFIKRLFTKRASIPRPSDVAITAYNHTHRSYQGANSTFMVALYDTSNFMEAREWAKHQSYRDSYLNDKAARRRLLDTSVDAKLDEIIDQIIAGDLTANLGPTEKIYFEAEARKNQNAYFKELKSAVDLISNSFDAYRLRFYLLNAFVQQQALDGRASLYCQQVVTSAGKTGEFRHGVHPVNLLAAWNSGQFRNQGTTMSRYVQLGLAQGNRPICATARYPDDFARAALTLGRLTQ